MIKKICPYFIPLFILSSISSMERNADFSGFNVVSGKKGSANGAKIVKFLQKKRKGPKPNLDALELNMGYMSSDSDSENDIQNKFYRSIVHNLNSRRTPLTDYQKFQHHILSRLYVNIEPVYKSDDLSYSFKIPSPFGSLTLVLKKCQKDDKHSFYLGDEKFYPFQTFVSHGQLKSDYNSLEKEFNSMKLWKRKKAIQIIDEYLNLQCHDSDLKTLNSVSDNGQNIVEFCCDKITNCTGFSKKELSALRTITAIIGFSEPLRIHDGGKSMRAVIKYNKLLIGD